MNNNTTPTSEDRIQELEKQLSVLREKYFFLETENKAISEEKEKYQLISDYAQDWEFWIYPKGDFKWLSPSCNDLTGYTVNEFFNDPNLFFKIIYPDDESQIRQFLRDSISFMQIGQSIEFRLLTRTKQLRWCELNSKGVFDRMGSYLGQRGSIRDITRLKSALGQIREMSDKQVWEMKTKQKYKDEIAGKDRELVTSLIQIAQKNEMVLYLRKNLSVIRNTLPAPIQKKVTDMLLKIDEHQRRQVFNWEDFKFHFEKVHQGFFTRLKDKYPGLTPKDQRLCAYINLGLSTKDIAGLVNITPESTEIGRIRLRKKLGLSRLNNLFEFLQEI
ncbi:MAG: PAS domain-containing protein [Bacteroidia bacterium]|nr:PAS domain-containing protein [Bacteroidia bacterium]